MSTHLAFHPGRRRPSLRRNLFTLALTMIVGICSCDRPEPKVHRIDLSTIHPHVTAWWFEERFRNLEQFEHFLDAAQKSGVQRIAISLGWRGIEPARGVFSFEEVDARVDRILAKGLTVAIILDAAAAGGFGAVPDHYWQAHPGCESLDSLDHRHGLVSMASGCLKEPFTFFHAAVQHLTSRHPGTEFFFQPNFNNEYELKYAQVAYAWQDYSPATLADFRQWIAQQNPDAAYWSRRWGRPLSSTESATLPVIEPIEDQQPDTRQLYLDWQRFREERLVEAHLQAADVVHAAGGKVLYHFGEWGTINDAIYLLATARIALSGKVDHVIIDSNLQDAYGRPNPPLIGAILAASSRRFPVPVTFEAAVERLDLTRIEDRSRLVQSMIAALENGANEVALANLVDPTQVPELLRGHFAIQPTTKVCEQAIYRSRWQAYALHGMGVKSADGQLQDQLQQELFTLFEGMSKDGCVEIWDDELVTPENLQSLRKLSLQGARIGTEAAARAIGAAEASGLQVLRDDRSLQTLLGADGLLQR